MVVVVMSVLAPEPTDPEAVPTLLDALVLSAIVVGLVGTVAAAIGRQYKALLWSIGLGLVWVATTIACPVSGHHGEVGWQWRADLVTSASLLVLSVVGARRLRAR